jgi:hypothetical protein
MDTQIPTILKSDEQPTVGPLHAIRAGMLLRVPKKIHRDARHPDGKNSLGVWSAPGDVNVWLEMKAGALLRISKSARRVDGVNWRKVEDLRGRVEGYALEESLRWLDLVVEVKPDLKVTPLKMPTRPPALTEWAYVGVNAVHCKKTCGQCIHIDHEHLPNPDHLGLATFRMLNGRSRKAWLLHAIYVNRDEIHNE